MTQCPAWRPGTRDIYSLQIPTLVVSPRPPPTTFPTQSPVSVTPCQSATSQQAVSRDGKLTANKSAVAEPFYAQYEKFQNNLSLKTQQSTYYDGRGKRCTTLITAPCQPLWPVSLSPGLSSVLTSSGFLDDVRGPPGNCVHAAPPPPAAVLWLGSTPAHHTPDTASWGNTVLLSRMWRPLYRKYYTDTFFLLSIVIDLTRASLD